ncbi:MAG TPA: SRPBCC domain-containing protein [Pseudonocardiaceae bacterium]
MGTSRRMEIEVALDATVEQVWGAIATGPGISSWFVPTTVVEELGGLMRQDFGSGFVADGEVTAWEPGRRFAYRAKDPDGDVAGGGAVGGEATGGEAAGHDLAGGEAAGGDGVGEVTGGGAAGEAVGGAGEERAERPDYAFEFLVEARDGGSTVLRFVQSGFLDGAEWDAEYDGFLHGWQLFFENLTAYLAHFPGRTARTVVTMGFSPSSPAGAWDVMHGALGLTGRPAVGDVVRLRPSGPAPVEGVVDVSTDHFLGVRSDSALYRFGAEGTSGCGVSAYHYHFGPVDLEAEQTAWQAWLTTLFPPPTGTPGETPAEAPRETPGDGADRTTAEAAEARGSRA